MSNEATIAVARKMRSNKKPLPKGVLLRVEIAVVEDGDGIAMVIHRRHHLTDKEVNLIVLDALGKIAGAVSAAAKEQEKAEAWPEPGGVH